MIDFIYKLYGYDHFTLYLTIIIVILIAIFVIVLIFGKKDQKLEETRRLEQIKLTGNEKVKETKSFKEEKKEPVKVEVKKEIIEEKNVNVTVFEPSKVEEEPVMIKEKEEDTPVYSDLPEINENMPINLDEFTNFEIEDEEEITPIKNLDDIDKSLEKDLSNLQSIKKEFGDIEIPTKEIKEEVVKEDKSFHPSAVFSSVYVNNEAKVNNNDDDDFDLPDLISDDNKVSREDTSIPEKKPEEIVLKDKGFSVDSLINETYNLK